MLNLLRLIGKTPKFRNSSLTSRSPGLHSDPPLLSLVKTPGHVVLSLIGQFLLLLVPQRTPPTIQIRICRLCKLHPHLPSNLNTHLQPHHSIPLQKPLVLPHRKTPLVDLLVRRNPRKGNSKGMLKQENAHRRLAAKLWSHTARLSLHTPVPLFTPPLLTMSPPTRLPTSPELSKRPWHRLLTRNGPPLSSKNSDPSINTAHTPLYLVPMVAGLSDPDLHSRSRMAKPWTLASKPVLSPGVLHKFTMSTMKILLRQLSKQHQFAFSSPMQQGTVSWSTSSMWKPHSSILILIERSISNNPLDLSTRIFLAKISFCSSTRDYMD